MKAVTGDYKICERKQTKTYFQLVIFYKLACLQKIHSGIYALYLNNRVFYVSELSV